MKKENVFTIIWPQKRPPWITSPVWPLKLDEEVNELVENSFGPKELFSRIVRWPFWHEPWWSLWK